MKDIGKLCLGCMKETNGETVCPFCGYDKSQNDNEGYLLPGTRIMKRFLVGKVTETNGEGATYICYDAKEDKTVHLREYFPAVLCERRENGAVQVLSEKMDVFADGIKKFLDLTNTLKNHPEITAVCPVGEVFEGNGTAYYIYDHFEGITLREFLLRNGGTLSWEQTRALYLPLLSSVNALHKVGVVHRGISPETILISKDGKVRLVGFCTDDARTVGSPITAQLFPGFAAVEQYGTIGEQGPWTDVYALAATMYRVLVGNPPIESIERVSNDTLSVPSKVLSKLPTAAAEALADGLQIMPEERTRSVETFRASVSAAAVKSSKKTDEQKKKSDKYRSYMLIATLMTTLIIAALGALLYFFVILPSLDDGTSSIPPTVSYDSTNQSTLPPTSSSTVGTVRVENFVGKNYQDILAKAEVDYPNFNFQVDYKDYSESYTKRMIMSQSPQPGEMVMPDENGKVTVKVVISLGSYNITMPDVIGCTEEEAKYKLMKAGFDYENISVNYVFDKNSEGQCIIQSSVTAGELVNLDTPIVLTFNNAPAE